MSPTLPRTRSFRRVKPMRLWYAAVGTAVLANLAVVVVLAQISSLHHDAPEPVLAVRTLHRQAPEPVVPAESLPPVSAAQPDPLAVIALPSLELPTASPPSELALPPLGAASLDLALPLSFPAFATTDGSIGGAGSGTLSFDTPAEREGAFDLDQYYPRSAKLRGVTGTTRVRIAIAADGRVSAVTVVESTPAGVFERAAERLVRSLRYRPALLAGQAVASEQETVIAWTIK